MSANAELPIGAEGAGDRLAPTADVIAQRVGDCVVIVNLRTNRMFELNHTAARFWELLSAGEDLAAIRTQLLQEFDVEPSEVAREISRTVDLLRSAGLVHPRGA